LRLELFNLAQDIGETTNLASAMPERAAALRTELEAWRDAQHAQMMEPNPEFNPPGGAPRDKTVPQLADGRVYLMG
jgi:arylsulfatase A